MFVVNPGGEGEVPGVLNQQGPWVLTPGWRSSQNRKTLAELYADGHRFLIGPNDAIPLPDDCADEVVTNNVPIDVRTWLGPGVQSSEIRRILKVGGKWFDNGNLRWTKP